MSNYIKIGGRAYAIDMNKFMSFISQLPPNEKESNTTITAIFSTEGHRDDNDTSLEIINKEVTENKSNNNDTFNNVRYDFVRILLNTLVTPLFGLDGTVANQDTLDELVFAQKLSFNTLLHQGIIIEINDQEEE